MFFFPPPFPHITFKVLPKFWESPNRAVCCVESRPRLPKSLFSASPLKVYFWRPFRCCGVFLWGHQIQTDQYLLSLKGLLKRLLTTNCLAAHPCLISGSPKVQEEMNAVMGHFRMSPSGLSELSAEGNNYSSIPLWARGNFPIILLLNSVY